MLAADIMTQNPTTLRSTDTVSEAVDLLQSLNVRHLPVVDERGHLIGMLSDRDLGPLMKTFSETAEADRMVLPLSERRVSDYMSGDAVSVEGDADVSEIITQMLDERIGAVPVVDAADNVIGIVSYVDVLRAFVAPAEDIQGAKAAVEPADRRGGAVDESHGGAYSVRPWAGGWGVFVGDANAADEPFRTAGDAVAHAKELARHSASGAQIRVSNEAGTLLSEFFYQEAERISLERDGTVPSIAASRPARRRPGSGASGR